MFFSKLICCLKKSPFFLLPFLITAAIIFTQLPTKAQQQNNLTNIRVDELSDDQIKKFIAEIERLNLTNEQIDQLAIRNGMSASELVKLKERINAGRKVSNQDISIPSNIKTSSDRRSDSISAVEQNPIKDLNAVFSNLQSQNFGFDLFNNPRITFEPNLKLPTPKNYTLSTDDELLIDVSGYSEANYKLRVSPEGTIRIPVVGAIHVNGLTVEQASRIITKRLANTLYYNIKTGNTFVDISLGAIRSIKVTIIGEANVPGTYTLPSLASAFNALYACGGPSYNGTLRNIQVVRNNEVVTTIDVYEYLLNGYKKNDIRLMDQDVIKINTYKTRIELKGEIKKPGMYDVVKGESLGEILSYAGGFTDNAYTAKILVFKNTSKERQVSNVNETDIASYVPQKGDSYTIGKINNRFSNRISLRGAVNRPGEYELRNNITLLELINEADGLREDAFVGRGTIHRLKADLSPEIISFDLESLLNGRTKDIPLKKEDRINIFSKFDLKEGYYVKIEGEVANPGVYLFEDSMTAEDVILMAGGFKESASGKRVEISRRVRGADSATVASANAPVATIYQKDISTDLKDSMGVDRFVLKPYDEISVYKSPGYFQQKNVVIEGEVIYGGKYTLEAKNDRISDLVKRAGGLTPEAYLQGAVLVRSKKLNKTEQTNASQGLFNLIKENLVNGVKPELLEFEVARTTSKTSESIGIELEEIVENPKSEYDLFLNDGDTLRIPKQLQTVRVNGEVLYPTLVRYNEDYKFKDYVYGAGGYSERSSKKKSYAVYPNGTIKGTKSFLFFKKYPAITPGTEIYIPVKRERERLRTGEVISIGATLSTLLLVAYSIFRK